MIPATTTNDPDLIFRVIMEAADERSQRDAAEVGMTTRLAVAEYGGPYLPAAGQTIAEGIGIYDKNPGCWHRPRQAWRIPAAGWHR